jgi:hypothetical protein
MGRYPRKHVVGGQHNLACPHDDLTRTMPGSVQDPEPAEVCLGSSDGEVDGLRSEEVLREQVQLHQIIGVRAPDPSCHEESAKAIRHRLQPAFEICQHAAIEGMDAYRGGGLASDERQAAIVVDVAVRDQNVGQAIPTDGFPMFGPNRVQPGVELSLHSPKPEPTSIRPRTARPQDGRTP